MLEETALVVDVRDDLALLQTQRKSACQSCSVKAGCGTSSLAKVVGKRSSQFTVKNTLGVKAGDEVVIAVQENALVQGSLLIYLLPLVFMLLSGSLFEYWFATEAVTVVGSLLGLVLSMFLVRYVLATSSLANSIQPSLLRRLS